jgi:hydroxymethylpyrimidine/phosphomethylpyrimidine kinase
MKHLLTIAGSDSSGGAGIQADLKTFAAHGCFGMSVITAVTAQNTQGVTMVQNIDEKVVAAQIDAVFSDIRVDAVKIGMVSQVNIINIIAERLAYYKPPIIVLDTVMVSKSGFDLLAPEACSALVEKLLPLATLVTPNLPEAERIVGFAVQDKDSMTKAAKKILALGAKNVLIKGGHLDKSADDFLYTANGGMWFAGEQIATKNTHGTGCTLSSSLTANLAQGLHLAEAVKESKAYVTLAIKHALDIGKGCGPTHHFVNMFRKAGYEE